MAEFILGRIKFVYRNNWETATAYVVDDVVTTGGKTYICIKNHTSSSLFGTDYSPNVEISKWNLLADGQQWREDWTAATYYNTGDLVKYGGIVYLCTEPHTSASYQSPTWLGLEDDIEKWDRFATASNWLGAWTNGTRYKAYDQVSYGGIVYICNTPHISASSTVTLTATAFTVSAGVATLTYAAQNVAPYAIGATVTLAGFTPAQTSGTVNNVNASFTVVTCTTTQLTFALTGTYTSSVLGTVAGTSQLGLEKDLSKWDTFNSGIVYRSAWSGSAVRYRANDVVKYGADLWICTTYHTSTTDFDNSKWSLFINGFQFESSWDNTTVYQIGDVVTYGGFSYIAKTNHTNKTPTSNPSDWGVYTTGFNFVGEWDELTGYKIGDLVRLGGYSYVATADNGGQVPPNASYWSRLNSGLRNTGGTEEYLAVSGVTQGSSLGTSATFDVTRSGTVYDVSVVNDGTNYVTGDSIIIAGTSVGGISPANDITITVTASSGNITSITWTGYSVTWFSDTVYVLGDIVFFGANTYTCILAHTSDVGNRPDADSTATYWNLLAAGAESATLTTAGDTLYYGPNGPTRLPIGRDGQVLRVTNGYPSWETYGHVFNAVYVGPTGVDEAYPAAGFSIDKPWKTVRFAARQIEEGYRNNNTKHLLEINKQFLIKETRNFIDYKYQATVTGTNLGAFLTTNTSGLTVGMPVVFTAQTGSLTLVSNPISSSTVYYIKTITENTSFTVSATHLGSQAVAAGTGTSIVKFSYDATKAERDAGIIIDGLVYDISHGGTQKTTANTLSFYDYSGTAYITSMTGYQINQFIGSHEYLKVMVNSVLNNVAIPLSYQTLNAVSSKAYQQIDTNYTADHDSIVDVEALLDIIIAGLTQGDTSTTAAAINPNTSINIKTGTYSEVLPIVVPANTALVGDELRSTVIQPKAANPILVNDKEKTIGALNRVKSLIPSIVSNTPVVTRPGNTATQEFIYNEYDSIVADSVNANVSTMAGILTAGIDTLPTITITDPDQYDSGYYNARRLIVANKAFIIDEVDKWIAAQISGNIAPFVGFVYSGTKKTKCQRDVGYIVDALQYDLTYQGNFATQIAARSYYSNGIFVETGEKLQALAVQARIKDFIDNIAKGNTAGWTKTTALSQTVSGTPGSDGAATFAQARIQEMYDTINTGTTPTTIAPSTSWVINTTLTNAFSAIIADKTAIRADCINWINTNYPDLVYNETTCSRDVGYMVDALAYDAVFGSNFLSIWNAMSYYRGLSSTAVVLTGQLTETINMVYHLGRLVQDSSAGTSSININSANMISILESGIAAAPTFIYTDPTGYGSGFYNARRLVIANKTMIKDEIAAYMNANYSTLWNTTLTADQRAACTRDIGYIVDALTYDLTYGETSGCNLATVIAARSYYSNGTFVENPGEKTAALACQTYLKSFIDNVILGTTGWGKITSTAQVTSGTAGSSTAATFAQARIQEVYDTINTGTTPTTIAPDTSWVISRLTTANTAIQAVKSEIQSNTAAWITNAYPNLTYNLTTCLRDVGYIIDAFCYDMMLGSNFLTTWNAMSYYRALSSTAVVLADQFDAQVGMVGFISSSIKSYTGETAGSTGTFVGIERAVASAKIVYDIVNGGAGAVPSFQFTPPTGYNTTYLATFGDGKAQIIQNYDFIVADTLQYYANGSYGSVWSSTTTEGRDKGKRDIKLILDALQHDMTYGGNYQSLVAGSAYYSSYLLNISAAEKPAFIDLFGFMKTLIGKIVRKDAITAQSGNTLTRVSTGNAGNSTAGTFAEARIQDVIDWITNGSAPTAIAPSITWADSGLQTAYAAIQSSRTEIALDATAWVKKFYQVVVLSTELTQRDAGLVVDAIAYDMVLGTNFNAISAGRRYLSNTTSTNTLLNGPEKAPTLGAINFIKYKVKNIAASGAIAQIQTTIDDITGTITGGKTPRISYPKPVLADGSFSSVTGTNLSGSGASGAFNFVRTVSGFTASVATAGTGYTTGNQIKILGSAIGGATPANDIVVKVEAVSGGGITRVSVSTFNDAVVLMEDNRSFILNEIVAYINYTYPSLEYDETLTRRDAGYILDALHYDLTYGGDFASQQAGQAYYSFGTSEISAYVKTATLAAISRLSTITQSIVQNSAVTATYGNTATQLFKNDAQIAGSLLAASTISSLVTKVYNYVNLGLTDGAPSLTITTIATTDTFTSNAHGLANGDLIEMLATTTNGLVQGTTYYVVSAATNTFKLASTYNGTALTTFSNDTGLTISVHKTNQPYIGWVDATLQTQYATLNAAKSTIQTNVVNFINTTYANLVYDSALASRDAGLAIDAVSFDFMFNSNFRSVKDGQSYRRPQSSVLLGRLLDSTRESLKYLQTQITGILYASQTAVDRVNSGMRTIIGQLVDGVGETPEMTGSTSYNNVLSIAKGVEILRANKDFLAAEATAWVDDYYGGNVSSTNSAGNTFTTSVSHHLTPGDPIKFTFTPITTIATATVASTKKITLQSTTGVVVGMPVTFSGTLFGAVSQSPAVYYVTSISGLDITISDTNGGSDFPVGDGSGLMTVNIGGVMGGVLIDTIYYVLTTPSITTFTITAEQNSSTPVVLSSRIGSMEVGYAYDATSCQRDMREFINAVIYDLQYTGNYKSKRAAELYLNAVNGSKLSDMFHVRNASGIRNMTMSGLVGPLSVPNDFGTKRPEGGAYTSLDPGFGPYDKNAWVNNRSCYVQNCSLFGNGATALKIDGSLHAGGNRSIVANDYTTFISDGIGTWCTGSNALTELVSVFAYYSYAGYLAELGGKIRATNGNSSYGTYGVIAEGVDTYETPLYGTLNNRGEEAYITNVVTDGAEQVLRIEMANAGINYTNAEWTISGAGYNATAIGDEFRDYGVFETRLVDLNDGYGYGGTGYLTAANASQLSTIGTIVLAASDTQLSTAYVGMRILVSGGTGAGQYAAILTYNNGSKTAKVYKESFTQLTVTATTAGGNNLLTVASTATLYAGMAIYLGSAIGGLEANKLYYIIAANFSTTQFAISQTSGGTAEPTTLTTGQTVTLYAAGWDHVIPGKTIVDSLDLTTTYVIEPRVTYTGPGYTSTARTLASSATWQAVAYGANTFLAIPTGSAATSYSANGTTWSGGGNLPSSTTWVDVCYGGGEGATATAVVGGLGGIGAQLTAVMGTGVTAGQVVSITIVKGGYGYLTPPTITFTGTGGSGTVARAVVLNGAITDVIVTIPGSGWVGTPTVTASTSIITSFTINSSGKNYTSPPTITVSGGGSTNQATGTASLTNNGVSSIAVGNSGGTGYTSQPTVTILDSNAKFVAIPTTASGGTTKAAYQTVTGASTNAVWTATTGSLPNGTYAAITYGGGYWVAIGGASTATRSADANTSWISVTIPTLGAGTYSSIAYGNQTFVAIATGTNATAISTTSGNSWAAGGNMPSSTTWTSVAYGNGRFLAIASSSRAVAYSLDKGITWVASATGLPSSQTWTKVVYGQGLFMAIASGTNICATSPDGVFWTQQVMPSSSNWKSLVFGNPTVSSIISPAFVAISNTSGQVGASIRTGATPIGRAKVASNRVTEIRMAEPGSGYPKGTITASYAPVTMVVNSSSGNNITVASTIAGVVANQPIRFASNVGTLVANTNYYVVTASGTTLTVTNTVGSAAISVGTTTGLAVNATTQSIVVVDNTINLSGSSQPVEFTNATAAGLQPDVTYYTVSGSVSSTSFAVNVGTNYNVGMILTAASGITGTWVAGPTVTITDPNRTRTAPVRSRVGTGVLGQPTFSNRGNANTTASANVTGDGFSDLYQPSSFINVSGLYAIPQAGSNVEFASIPDTWFKLVSVSNILGQSGSYTATFQINPSLSVLNAPRHNDQITTRLKYSQSRLTGHDFLYIGTGGFAKTNYPEVNVSTAITANQTLSSNGGRCFFTSTDQDGNFNVGNLFGVQQSTGTATLNASAFNLSGLQSLQLGTVTVGAGSAVITSFSTDPYFTANSDNILPTQKAIKSYITAQIGGGQSALNVNTLTSGVIFVANNTISTTANQEIRVKAKMNFTGGIDGAPVALAYFMQK
jgi:hypothetical protein